MKTNKVTQYTTRDGEKFFGVKSFNEALEHDKKCTDKYMKTLYEHAVGKLLMKEDYPSFSGKYKDIEEFWDTVNHDDKFGDKWGALMSKFSSITICPDDLDDFTELGDMIAEVVDLFGGIEVIELIIGFSKIYRE